MSVYNPQTSQSLLEQLASMSTDIRTQKKMIQDAIALGQSALEAGQNAQSSADAAASAVQVVSGTVQTISAEMVRKFTSAPIAAASFILNAVTGYFYATVEHNLGDAAPDIEVYDNDKDKQVVQSILVDSNTIKLELSAADMASNSFPLTCIVLGKNTPASNPVDTEHALPGTPYTVKFNSANPSIAWTEGNGWVVFPGSEGASEAFLASDNWINFKRAGEFFKIYPTMAGPSPTDQGGYEARKAESGSILLGVAA